LDGYWLFLEETMVAKKQEKENVSNTFQIATVGIFMNKY